MECLRQEVSEYGALYQFFEDQQAKLFARDPDGVLRLSGDIEVQVRSLHECRRQRESAVVLFASEHGQPINATIRSLMPYFPIDARPLIDALISEINVLIHRVRRMSRRNYTLLSRTVDLQQQFLRQLMPSSFSQTYKPNGRMALAMNTPTRALHFCG